MSRRLGLDIRFKLSAGCMLLNAVRSDGTVSKLLILVLLASRLNVGMLIARCVLGMRPSHRFGRPLSFGPSPPCQLLRDMKGKVTENVSNRDYSLFAEDSRLSESPLHTDLTSHLHICEGPVSVIDYLYHRSPDQTRLESIC